MKGEGILIALFSWVNGNRDERRFQFSTQNKGLYQMKISTPKLPSAGSIAAGTALAVIGGLALGWTLKHGKTLPVVGKYIKDAQDGYQGIA